MDSLRLSDVRNQLRDLDIVITTTRDAEYRVNFRNGHEVTAYYTTDLADALGTGLAMAPDAKSTARLFAALDPNSSAGGDAAAPRKPAKRH